jgi:hypothetical protein
LEQNLAQSRIWYPFQKAAERVKFANCKLFSEAGLLQLFQLSPWGKAPIIDGAFASISWPEQPEALNWDWRFWGRPNQLLPNTPGSANQFLTKIGTPTVGNMADPGWPRIRKTSTGAECIKELVCGTSPM